MEVQDDNLTAEVKRFPADWLRTANFKEFCAVHGVDKKLVTILSNKKINILWIM